MTTYYDEEFGYDEPVRFRNLAGATSDYLYDSTNDGPPIVEPDTVFAVKGTSTVPVRVDAEKFPIAVVGQDGQLDQTLQYRADPFGKVLRDPAGRAIRALTEDDLNDAAFQLRANAAYQQATSGSQNRTTWLIVACVGGLGLLLIVLLAILIGGSGGDNGNRNQQLPDSVTTSGQPNPSTVTVTEEPETSTVTETPDKTTVTRTETETSTTTVTETPPTVTVQPTESSQRPGINIPLP